MSVRKTASPSSKAGFTLVEMLMAMLVMTVGLLGLLQSVQAAYRQTVEDRVRDEAVRLAEEQMHRWRWLPYDSFSGNSQTVARTIGGGTRTFQVTRESLEMGASGGRPARKLQVSVTWNIGGRTIRHEIYSLKAK